MVCRLAGIRMTETKSERLGLKGRIAHLESALRLIGGANATGAIAAGAAFHAFAQNADVQSSVKLAAVLFLFGIFTFVIAYMGLFMMTLDIEHSLHKEGDETWPEYLFWKPAKSAAEYRAAAKKEFGVAIFVGLASFVCFFVGLASVLMMAIHLQLGAK
jgi:hypothetical protein